MFYITFGFVQFVYFRFQYDEIFSEINTKKGKFHIFVIRYKNIRHRGQL